jgi:uncharacterized protein
VDRYSIQRPESVEIDEPALLVRISRLYRPDMPAEELYEATRGVWRLSTRREGAAYAMAVFEGVVLEVYEIDSWLPAGTTPYYFRDVEELPVEGRWEFVGRLARNSVRSKYLGRSVAAYFKQGAQNPIAYVEC